MYLRNNLFFVYAVSFAFAVAAFFCFSRLSFYSSYEKELNLAAVGIYSWIPGLFAIFFAKKENIKISCRSKLGYPFLFAVFVPLIVAVLGVFLSLPFSSFSLNQLLEATQIYHLCFRSQFFNVSLFVIVLYGISFLTSISFNFFFNLGQEIFWRGYIWEKLKHLGFAKKCFISGALFSIWFAPLILFFGHNYPYQKFWGIVLMFGFSNALTPILSFLREKEKSIMSCTIFYSMILTFSPITVVFFPEGNPLLIAPVGIAGIFSLACISAPLLYLMHEKKYKAANI